MTADEFFTPQPPRRDRRPFETLLDELGVPVFRTREPGVRWHGTITSRRKPR